MSITNPQDWADVEQRARQHEASINQVMCAAGLPMVTITCEDRQRGAIVEAIRLIEEGCDSAALFTLQNALKL